jgi:hydroxymethylpyrimidine pyrophosphatase-like HAD family hydrolase/orotate phosphoribosyltransferase
MKELRSDCSTLAAEERFYSSYSWCLNPILSLRELFHRLREEFDRYEQRRVNWQQEECKINLYLFVCAITCTIDDYLGRSQMNLSRIAERFPPLRLAVVMAQKSLDMTHLLRNLFWDRTIMSWKEMWVSFVDQVCTLLVNESEPSVEQINELKIMFRDLLETKLPDRLLGRRMILPEGFRSQDLTHQDLFTMIRHFIASHRDLKESLVIIGPRTFGAYFAPLAKAYLSAMGWSSASWMTIRPKRGVSMKERKQLRTLISRDAHILLVDDCPNTGRTSKDMVKIVRQFGVAPGRITILVPRHPAQLSWTLDKEPGEVAQASIIRLEPEELYKESLLRAGSVGSLLQEYFGDGEWKNVSIQENSGVDEINSRLQQHYGDGFHVRLKKVFDVRLTKENQVGTIKRVFAKSVGWGWFGYHAYLSGVRLADFVPKIIGLRNGLLFYEWIEGISQGQDSLVSGDVLKTLSFYVARRSEALRLAEDPCFGSPGYRWTAWEEILKILRSAYGPYLGRLMIPILRRQLKRYISPMPTMIDGRMKPDEWIKTETGICKVDFEHHNFGGPELDIVDPAYDLVSAIFEFQLSEQEEQEVLNTYVRESGDRTIFDRIFLFKLLYGIVTLQGSAYWIIRASSDQKREEWNQRYLLARDFLVYHTNQFCINGMVKPHNARWSKHLFFLDLDGVFDTEIFGFPHTTLSGIEALRLLQSHAFSIVLNTGRSVEHVYNYCQTYGIPGGLAEYGSVFFDAVQKRELPLIDAEATEEMVHCREAMRKIPGVFVDTGYRYSIRAYRYNGLRTSGLQPAEVKDLLTRLRCDRLTFICRTEDTYVVQKGIGKGSGLLAVKKYLGYTDSPVIAMGNSKQDVEMLELAEFGYAPANSSNDIRELGDKGGCRVMSQPFQRGLLEAVLDVVRDGRADLPERKIDPIRAKYSQDFIWFLLHAAEMPNVGKFLATLKWLYFGGAKGFN